MTVELPFIAGLVLFFLGSISAAYFLGLRKNRPSTAPQDDELIFLRSVIDSMPVALFCKDSQKDFRITIWNKMAETMWGFSASQAIGKQDEDLFPPDQAEFFRKKDIETLNKGEIVDIPEEPIDTPSRGRLYFHTMKVPLRDTHDHPRYLLGISENITQRKVAEDRLNQVLEEQHQSLTELKRQQNLVRAHQLNLLHASKMTSLGEMAGGVAHEINNPLAIIKGHADHLLRIMESEDPDIEKVRKSTHKISATADRIARIVAGLRSFARDGSGDPFLDVPIRQIIEETMEFCRARFLSRGIDLIVDDISEDIVLQCRSVQISQVLLNILNNAYDAVADQLDKTGETEIGAGWVRIEVEPREDRLILAVIDSGPGVSHEIASKIMQPFFTTKQAGKGSGLGLSIAASIIKAHQGLLYFDRKSPHTRFVIELPRHQ